VTGETGKRSGRLLLIGLLLFVFALALRLLFLLALPNTAGVFSPYYKGDTPTWLGYAQAIRSSRF
jgi:hypothetical protein